MKKTVSLILAVCMMALVVAAVAEMDFAGTTWYLTSAEQNGTTINPAEYGMSISMTLNADGTSSMVAYGEEVSGSWSLSDGILTVTDDTGTPAEFTLGDDGALILEMDGGKMFFTQDAPEAPAADDSAGYLTAESEEAFFGSYRPVSASMLGIDIPLEQLFGDVAVLTVEAGKVITTIGEGENALTSEEATVFEDGMLKVVGEDGESVSATVQLAEDGSIVLVMEQDGMSLTISTEKVEVAVAE